MNDTKPLGDVDVFWKLGGLSDREVLERLRSVVGSSRRLLAELVAHLGEVEERRLHLDAACSSMFDYCVNRLGLSEDAAYRRIEVARLARRFPAIYPKLASGELSLSVAALLKHHLAEPNADALLSAVSGCSVSRTREVLAGWFPRPDVPTRVRKLPERLVVVPQPLPGPPPEVPSGKPSPEVQPAVPCATQPETPAAPLRLCPPQPTSARVEPLSSARYKIQFTAGVQLKQKLELARDMLRHTVPGGDFAAIIERAVDLLVADLKKRRFGALGQRRLPQATPIDGTAIENTAAAVPLSSATSAAPSTGAQAASSSSSASVGQGARQPTRAARRAVAERDGARCTWTSPDGERCAATAWLEYDHRQPRARGGHSDPENLRLLCRNHNRLAAEQTFGKEHVQGAIRSAQQRIPNASKGPPNGKGPS